MSLFWTRAMVVEKGVNLDERTVEGFASTKQPDMIRDVILPKAWKKSLARWKKRGSMPKFLAYHMHRLLTGHSPVLGPMLSMKIVPEGLMLKAEFAETELGNEHLHLYAIGAMDYFSVGFRIMPNGSTMDSDTVRQLLRQNNVRARVPEDVDRVIFEADLFETSAVVLGANLGALVTASGHPDSCCGMCGDDCKGKCSDNDARALRAMHAGKILERLEKCAAIIPDGAGKAAYIDAEKYIQEVGREMTEDEAKALWVPSTVLLDSKGHPLAGVVDGAEDAPEPPPATTPGVNRAEEPVDDIGEGIEELVHPKLLTLPELPTDGTVTVKQLATAEATLATAKESVGTVNDPLDEVKRVIPFKDLGYVESEATAWDAARQRRAASVEDLMKMSAWVDAENSETKGAYKLPHHQQSDFKAVWRGVSAAMGALLGARGGTQIPASEKQGVYNHLKKHYTHWDKEAPEFRDYTGEELKGLEKKGLVLTEETLEAEQRGLDRDLLLAIVERVEALESRMTESESDEKSLLESILKAVKSEESKPGGAGSPEHQTDPPEGAPTEDRTGDGNEDSLLLAILKDLEHLSGSEPETG